MVEIIRGRVNETRKRGSTKKVKQSGKLMKERMKV